jgi:hypothetical protein
MVLNTGEFLKIDATKRNLEELSTYCPLFIQHYDLLKIRYSLVNKY